MIHIHIFPSILLLFFSPTRTTQNTANKKTAKKTAPQKKVVGGCFLVRTLYMFVGVRFLFFSASTQNPMPKKLRVIY